MAKIGYQEFRQGWPIVLSSMVGIGLGLSPLPFYTMSFFAPHLVQAFHWNRGDIMFGLTVTTYVVLWAGPLVGLAAARWGVRPVTLISLVLFSIAFMALGLSNGSLKLYYFNWALVALFGAGTLPITWTRAVNHWFDARKGMALGMSLMGTGLFGIFCPALTSALIAAFGWRGAYVGLGLLPLLIATPLALFMFRDRNPAVKTDNTKAAPATGLTLLQTFGQWRFWLIAAAIIPISFSLAGSVPNMTDILKTGGVSQHVILEVTPFIGLSALCGRLIGGWLLDRLWAPAVAFVILCLPGVSYWILAHGHLDFSTALLSIVLIGFALGVEYDVIAFFVARYFGMRSYTAIYGILYGCFALGSGFAPFIFGRSFDARHSYEFILSLSFVLLIVSAASLLMLGAYRKFDPVPEAVPTNLAAA